ncbi:MAG: signal peptide peptidase SppA [Candidatus Nanohaloarchaea archaeon]
MLERIEWYHLVIGFIGFAVLSLAVVPPSSQLGTSLGTFGGELAVIEIDGMVSYGSGFRTDGTGPRTVAELTEKAREGGAKAILYEINSGGGSVVASKRTSQIVERVDIPTVCRLKEVATSGAYWIASACDRVVADPLTLTGSIGVRSSYLEFSGLLRRFGVEYVNLSSGEYKDMGSRFKNLTSAERRKFNDLLNETHSYFVRSVAENRNMSVEEVRKISTGEVYLGKRARELGLVDVLGGRRTAVELAENMTGTQLRTKTYSPPKRFDILSLLFSSIGKGIAQGMKSMEKSTLRAS